MIWINWGLGGHFGQFGSRKIGLHESSDSCALRNGVTTWMNWSFDASLNRFLNAGNRLQYVNRGKRFLDATAAEIIGVAGEIGRR